MTHFCRKTLLQAFRERQQKSFQLGEGVPLSQSAFLYKVDQDLTFVEYLLKLFDSVPSNTAPLEEGERPQDSVDIPLKAIIASCILLDLRKALTIYQGDPVYLVSQLYQAVEVMAGHEETEIMERYEHPIL